MVSAVTPPGMPSKEVLLQRGIDLGMPLSEGELEIVLGLTPGLLNSYEEIMRQDTASISVPIRGNTGKSPSENPHHAWTWKCAIPPTSKGVLDGVKVVIK
ncbi:MAG: hypothetical protein WCJ91_09310, partial [Actinomycetes bacterium]